ncbi:hypothetical protein RHM58_07480 [Pseudomonas sp. 10S4]|uniref:hypothetical protein n=1 Tax=unclassified Pseudomonas TaxID=196821 RepID=UPI002AC950DB|nr:MULTISPECIES: hypothetical protein [unclassified Pseudomonas]MEB0225365.1 hypothetical protein [Pseudomonas sp. 5S1]WPX19807.1 hypothetical protein RHM58_07480 [Pseudomonas sp. 10S4]
MKKILLLLIGLMPLTAHCEVTSENLCFQLDQDSPVKFELRTYYDASNKWQGGFVKYASSGVPISLVLTDDQAEEVSPDRPWLTTQTWSEVLDGKVTGEYEMVSQGGMIVSMNYTKKSNGKEYGFLFNPAIDSSPENGCQWEQ